MTDAYIDAFELFLASTDEKDVLAKELRAQLKLHRSGSLLDIGAGNGQLGARLVSFVNDYLAIEARESYAAQIRSLGLEAVTASWPCNLNRTYDAVLMSYVLTADDDLEKMLQPAVDSLNPEGLLLIVLHDVEGTDWGDLLDELAIPHRGESLLPNKTLRLLRDKFALDVTVNYATSYACTADVEEMLAALRFVVSAGIAERVEPFNIAQTKVTTLLQTRYKLPDGSYKFPFRHLIAAAVKDKLDGTT